MTKKKARSKKVKPTKAELEWATAPLKRFDVGTAVDRAQILLRKYS